MEKTYISITITYYGSRILAPEVHYYRNDNLHPVVSTWDKLTVAEANQMMWELVKLGAKNTYRSNAYNNRICERKVTFYGVL